MTTPQTAHTPYDEEIDRYNTWSYGESPPKREDGTRIKVRDHLNAYHKREGYLRAKAEDADLLAAVEAAIGMLDDAYWDGREYGIEEHTLIDVDNAVRVLRAAIAKATEGQP